MNSIDSVNNPKIKYLSRLVQSSKERHENGEFLLEGLRLCLDCINNSHIKAKSVFFTEDTYRKHKETLTPLEKQFDCTLISQSVANKLSDTKSTQGVFVLCEIPSNSADSISYNKKYIALDNVSNPDNFGAVCRTAEALGIDGLIVSGGVDIYNPKSTRSAMGSSLRLNIIETDDLKNVLLDFKRGGGNIFATVPNHNATDIRTTDFSKGTVCVVGNEANGVSKEIIEICEPITIPMDGKAESLNASTAAAITMWEMIRR